MLAGLHALPCIVMILAARPAHAGTLTFPTEGMPVLSFPARVSAGRDMAPGSVLSEASGDAGIATRGANCTITKDVTVKGTLVPGYNNVYQTGVPGIGVRFYITANYNGNWSDVPTSQTFYVPDDAALHYTRADLVVTGPVSSGTTSNLPSMFIKFSGSCITTVTATQTLTGNTSVTGNSCSVTTPTLAFTLPRAFFKDLSSIGATTGDTTLPLGLNCPAGVKVGITVTDAVNPANRSSTLSLAANSSAAGVGVQIVNGTTPVSFGPDSAVAGTVNQWIAGTSTGGAAQIPLTARYVRTSGTLVPGSVNGKATFTMSYQ
ncbi:fimbrial protein [Caballeronia sp. LZ034LL]|uniref:fimbrial protein n=1 Tax=Caballeronia sp. LZ034LL TaxID=3038567 RepID=UPI00285CDEDA|nr:fimbrial protein [Caballeronia sp. LZ034LL]MDR5838928.1 fimbrial protein [Caballeronia sp. LZ034LL]